MIFFYNSAFYYYKVLKGKVGGRVGVGGVGGGWGVGAHADAPLAIVLISKIYLQY